MDSDTIIVELEKIRSLYKLSKYYKSIQQDFEKEYGGIFNTVCFHDEINVIVTLSTIPKESIGKNSVICIRVLGVQQD